MFGYFASHNVNGQIFNARLLVCCLAADRGTPADHGHALGLVRVPPLPRRQQGRVSDVAALTVRLQ